ncbi:MAG TPA: two-component regulator propeller domain-containing protein [Phycisphaerae bacterium]|nr:two-component regulator propeller domain-containing protein [Phycisphaerae bacterium]
MATTIRKQILSLLVLFCGIVCSSLRIANGADQSLDWTQTGLQCPASFVVSMARDLQGRIWIGTEDEGVFCFDPSAPDQQWTNYTMDNGLSDDSAYAIACDKLGRIWVGTLNHGVSVYNGVKWQTYSAVADPDHQILAGPLGEHVFAIAISPVDGDVWMATDAGLTRYSVQKDSWSYFTQADGLPSNQTSSLAFAADGTLYVGTQCDGIGMARPDDDYKSWSIVTGPEQLPLIAQGSGLPSCLVNCLLVEADGTVLAGTNGGLAYSSDKGKTWEFIRGQDYEDKVRDGYPPVAWQSDADITDESLLPEDHITSLAQDDRGRIWIGTWRQGFEVFDAPLINTLYTGGFTKSKLGTGKFVTAFLPLGGDETLVSGYGVGVALVGDSQMPNNGITPAASTALLPSGAQPPSDQTINTLVAKLAGMPAPASGQTIAGYLDDDWTTQGNWVGRYGNRFANLPAGWQNITWMPNDYSVSARTGPHRMPGRGEYCYYWLSGANYTSSRSLLDPVKHVYFQGEWNDTAAQGYSITWAGPDMYIFIKIPAGVSRISFYFNNDDGHRGPNANRDYELLVFKGHVTDQFKDAGPILAKSRVEHFWQPVYKSFVVAGPGEFTFVFERNYSLNTMVSGVFIDRLAGATNISDSYVVPTTGQSRFMPPSLSDSDLQTIQSNPAPAAAWKLWNQLDDAWTNQSSWPVQYAYRILAYRAAEASGAPESLLTEWRWGIGSIWTDQDRNVFDTRFVSAAAETN